MNPIFIHQKCHHGLNILRMSVSASYTIRQMTVLMIIRLILLLHNDYVLAGVVKTVTVSLHQDAVLDCHLPSLGNPKEDGGHLISFHRRDTPITVIGQVEAKHKNDYEISRNSSFYSLKVKDVTENDEGLYVCKDFAATIPIMVFDLRVLVEPTLPLVACYPEEVTAGMELNVSCTVERSNPPANFLWYLNGKPLEADDPHWKISKTAKDISFLRNEKCSHLNDGDVLTCSVSNNLTAQPKNDSRKLNVNYAPMISLKVNELSTDELKIKIAEGQPLLLSADVVSNPEATRVYWYKNGSQLITEGTVLDLGNVEFNYTGDYVIAANNSVGLTERALRVNILYSPRVTLSSVAEQIKEGDDLTLYCEIDSWPPHHLLVWQKDGHNLSISQVNSGQLLINKYQYTLVNVSRSDSGRYRCLVSNLISGDTSKPAKRSFGYADAKILILGPPALSVPAGKLSADISASTKLQCLSKGFPRSILSWHKDDHSFECSRQFSKDDMSYCVLEIDSVSDYHYGKYTCRGKNDFGTATSTIELTGKSAPDTPINVTQISNGFTWVYTCWEPGFDGGSIQTFTVESQPMLATHQQLTRENCYNFTGIDEQKSIRIRVKSRNGMGESSWTEYIKMDTIDFPMNRKDLPYVRDPTWKSSCGCLQFSLSPMDPVFSEDERVMCMRIYYSSQPDNTRVMDMYPECLEIVQRSVVYTDELLRQTKARQLKLAVCASEKPGICGEDVVVEVDILIAGYDREAVKMLLLWIAFGLLFGLLLCGCVVGICCRYCNNNRKPNYGALVKTGQHSVTLEDMSDSVLQTDPGSRGEISDCLISLHDHGRWPYESLLTYPKVKVQEPAVNFSPTRNCNLVLDRHCSYEPGGQTPSDYMNTSFPLSSPRTLIHPMSSSTSPGSRLNGAIASTTTKKTSSAAVRSPNTSSSSSGGDVDRSLLDVNRCSQERHPDDDHCDDGLNDSSTTFEIVV